MLVDWIKLNCPIEDIELFISTLTLQRIISVDEVTGEIINATAIEYRKDERRQVLFSTYERKIPFGSYEAIAKTTYYRDLMTGLQLPTKHNLEISGSPHCNHYAGYNYQRFSFGQLLEEINLLTRVFNLDPAKTEIHGIEIGVNIPVSFPVYPFLRDNLLMYSGSAFQLMKGRAGSCGVIGFEVSDRSQDVPKVYDKALQNNLPVNLMRWELHYKRMQPILNHLAKDKLYLSDLQERDTISQLANLLLGCWDNVLIGDIAIPIHNLPISPSDKRLMEDGLLKDYWRKLRYKDTEAFKYQRRKFKKFTQHYGENLHEKIRELIIKELEVLSIASPNLPTVKNDRFPISHSSVQCKYGEKDNRHDHSTNNNLININYTDQDKGQQKLINSCQCCGKDISHQKKGSKYCSKQCRNRMSNAINNPKRKRTSVADQIINQALRKLDTVTEEQQYINSRHKLERLRARMQVNKLIFNNMEKKTIKTRASKVKASAVIQPEVPVSTECLRAAMLKRIRDKALTSK